MCGLEARIAPVERVATAVAGEARGLAAVVTANVAARGDVFAGAVLVDVVTEVHHEVEVLVGQVAVGRVVAVLELLHEAKANVSSLTARPRWGTVAVRPTGLVSAPALKR